MSNCLQSVNSQELPAEHIIVDGSSTDNTLELVRTYSPNARIISEPDAGIYDAMNKGIALARGEIIGILNADDFYTSPSVLRKISQLFNDPCVMSCYGDLEYVAERERVANDSNVSADISISSVQDDPSRFRVVRFWKSGHFKPGKFFWGWMPPHPTFFVRRSVYEAYGLFRLDLGSAADYEMMLRLLLKHRISTAYIPEVLVRMRTGGASNSSLSNRLTANRMDRKAWQVNGLNPYPWTLLFKPLRKITQWVIRRR